ncbi:MAG: hypothetical protein M5T52_23900, partial [Ignavibacteriaceae bacterium]|nr:hypothetical protein [Ignavibacteriaceae bacterium]
YKLRYDDQPFGQSWQDWSDAVTLGADFYDGDGDGIYVPEDKIGPNGEPMNGQWDSWEDRPDILGNETLWCVYHDGVPSNQRRWNTVEPQGIEIRQTVFAYSSVEELKDIIFIRYRIKNHGMVTNKMTEVYFGVWVDPDLGGARTILLVVIHFCKAALPITMVQIRSTEIIHRHFFKVFSKVPGIYPRRNFCG